MNKSSLIDNYWLKNSAAFSNQYVTIFGLPLTPVGIFLCSRFKKISRILNTLPGEKVVDVGCGSGVFLAHLLSCGKRVIGIDYSAQMLEMVRKNLKSFSSADYELKRAHATKLPEADKSTDIVLASGLTDYLAKAQTKEFMSEVGRILKKGGHAVITFPKVDSPFAFLRTGMGLSLREKFLKLPPMETAYSKTEIMQMFAQAKLEPIRWEEVMGTMQITVGRKL